MANSPVYTKHFFEHMQTESRRSAMEVVPIVLELIRPTSIVDIGCGTGEFLKVFQEHGVVEILGIDGAYVKRSQLAILQEQFRALDISMPFTLDRTYDLAVCLEVAEHIAPESAPGLIESLTHLAPIILFSAAIPHQGGTHHVNEQWPEYWAQLFRTKGFEPVDALRKKIWNNRQIEVWYRQNAILFCSEQILESNSALEKEFRTTNSDELSMVHPELFVDKCKYLEAHRHKTALDRIKMLAKRSKVVSNIYYHLRS